MNNPIVGRIDKTGGHYHLLLENLGDDALEDVQVLTVNPKEYEATMQIKFDPLPLLGAKSTEVVTHHVNIVKDREWASSDWFTDDMLMCLTAEYSKGVSYDIHVSWAVNGKYGFNQTLKAGAGGDL